MSKTQTVYAERSVTLTRVLKAPRALVWRAWTDMEMLKEWWGPEQFTNPVIEGNIQVDGVLQIIMHGPKGLAIRHRYADGQALSRDRARQQAGVRE